MMRSALEFWRPARKGQPAVRAGGFPHGIPNSDYPDDPDIKDLARYEGGAKTSG